MGTKAISICTVSMFQVGELDRQRNQKNAEEPKVVKICQECCLPSQGVRKTQEAVRTRGPAPDWRSFHASVCHTSQLGHFSIHFATCHSGGLR